MLKNEKDLREVCCSFSMSLVSPLVDLPFTKHLGGEIRNVISQNTLVFWRTAQPVLPVP